MNFSLFIQKTTNYNNRLSFIRLLSTTSQLCLNQKWRRERGLPLNPNASGILTDGADFTFLDGRLTPYNTGQKKRIEEQRAIAEKIIKLSGEIDFAVNRHKQNQIDEENRKKEIIARKLKPKGANLLKSK